MPTPHHSGRSAIPTVEAATSLEHETYLDDEDPSPYIGPDEDLAYESWRDNQLTES
jgi:hypothetical protein